MQNKNTNKQKPKLTRIKTNRYYASTKRKYNINKNINATQANTTK